MHIFLWCTANLCQMVFAFIIRHDTAISVSTQFKINAKIGLNLIWRNACIYSNHKFKWDNTNLCTTKKNYFNVFEMFKQLELFYLGINYLLFHIRWKISYFKYWIFIIRVCYSLLQLNNVLNTELSYILVFYDIIFIF